MEILKSTLIGKAITSTKNKLSELLKNQER